MINKSSHDSDRVMYMYVSGIIIVFVSTNYLFDLGNVPTVWYFLFVILSIIYFLSFYCYFGTAYHSRAPEFTLRF
jgi:hypothetical protein